MVERRRLLREHHALAMALEIFVQQDQLGRIETYALLLEARRRPAASARGALALRREGRVMASWVGAAIDDRNGGMWVFE